MYGFHKKVGLSHNSMRASERKNKDPSEYSNPYFRRGRPNLLWLIQKPKNPQGKSVGKGGGRTKQEDFDEDIDETFGRDNSPMPLDQESLETSTGMHGRQQPLLTMGNMAARLPQDELASLRQELQTVQRNQNMIREMLNQTRREHAQLYGQAKAFHELHEKHDNSINAILTFLATVYNKNLASGREGSGDMFPGAIPSNDQPHGEIVDMGDEKYQEHDGHQHYRREPLLIEDGRATSNSPSVTGNLKPQRASASSKGKYRSFGKNQPMHSPQIQELSDRTPSNRSSESPQIKPSDNNQIPKADIMSMINSAIARDSSKSISGSRMEFPEALSHLQNADGQTPLTPNQRDNMLQLMANEHTANSPNNTNNALTYPSASPIPNQADLNFTNDQLNQIQQSLREQDERMANIQNTIAPLSPSGSIPGISDGSYSGPNGQDMLDLDQIFNSGDYFNDGGPVADIDFDGADLPDFDFGPATPLDEIQAVGNGDVDGGRVVGSIDSSEVTSPANTIDSTVAAAAAADLETTSSPRQRRRRG